MGNLISLREAIEEFLLAGRQGGWSAGTIRVYSWHLEQWCAWLAGKDVTMLGELDRKSLRAWGASLHDRWSPSTCKQATTAVRSFLRWSHTEGLAPAELAASLRMPRVPKRVQRTVGMTEVERLLEQCQVLPGHGVDTATGMVVRLRDSAIITMLYDTLARNAELCGLDVADVDLDNRRAVVTGKGGARLPVPFSERTADRLRNWLDVRPDSGSPALFVAVGANTGARLTPRGLRQILSRIAARAGLPKLSPHAFRRGGACAATERGVPSRVLQVWGRWSSITMVEEYTRALGVGAVVEDYLPGNHLDQADMRRELKTNRGK